MASKSKSSKKGPRGGGIQDLAEAGQQLVAGASGRAEDILRRARDSVQETVKTLEKRRGEEMKNLTARLKDVNISVSGLERRYQTLEKRFEKQIKTLSNRAVKATDFEKRVRSLEGEIRRLAGLGDRPPVAPSPPSRAATSTRRARTTAPTPPPTS